MRTGDLSLLTTLGRKGKKSSVTLYNVRPDEYRYLPRHLTSIAWSYEDDAPIKEEVELRIHLRTDLPIESTDGDIGQNTPDTPKGERTGPTVLILNDRIKRAYQQVHQKAERHLGVFSTTEGDTAVMTDIYKKKAKARLEELKVYQVRGPVLQFQIKAMLCSITGFAPLICGLSLTDTTELDKMVTATIRKQCSLTKSDAAELLYVNTRHLGLGFFTFTGNHVAAVARETEITLNDKSVAAKVVRGRYKNWCDTEGNQENGKNFIRKGIKLCGRYGLYIRDQDAGELGNRTADLLSLCGAGPIGRTNYEGKGSVLGTGKDALEKLSARNLTEAAIHRDIKEHDETRRDPAKPATWRTMTATNKPRGFSAATLAKAYQQATKEQKHDMVVLYEVWEWRRTTNNAAQDPWTSDHGWEKLTIEASGRNDPWDHTRERAEEKLRLPEGEFGEYIVGLATNNGAWPFMVAIYGGHKHFMEMKEGGKTGAWTSAAMVVLEAPKTMADKAGKGQQHGRR